MKDDKKHAANYLNEDFRNHLKGQLEDSGIKTDDMSDDEITKKLSEIFAEEKEKRKNAEITKEVVTLNMYIAGVELKKEFVERLYRMSVPKIFLEIFKDRDAELSDKKIWEKIHVCDILQIKRIADFYSKRA